MTAILYVEAAKRVTYDPETGVMLWKYDKHMSKSWNSKHAGKRAGSIANRRYRTITVEISGISHCIYTRRLAYFILHGELPELIGTIDGDSFNDSSSNLIALSRSDISKKSKRRLDNVTGVTGVQFSKHANKWLASVCANGSYVGNMKYFDNKEDAASWVKQKRIELGFNPDLHGRG